MYRGSSLDNLLELAGLMPAKQEKWSGHLPLCL